MKMSKKLSKEQVVHLARLAKLELSEDEIEKYQEDLSSILEYFEMLQDVDTTGLEPTSQVSGLTNVMRQDAVQEQKASPESLLMGAPRSQDGYIKVHRMI